MNKMPRLHPLVVTALLVLGGLLVACSPAPAPPKVFIVGVLNTAPATQGVSSGFKAEMEALGYAEGQNIQYVYGEVKDPSPQSNDLKAAAQSLVDAKADVILAVTTPAADRAKEATATSQTPVIFYGIRDPRDAGHVEDLQRPGGNMTGIAVGIEGTPTEGRRLEWLKQIVPDVQRIYVPYNPNDVLVAQSMKTLQEAADKLGIELLLRETTSQEESQAAIAAIPEDADAIFPVAGLADRIFAQFYSQVGAVALERDLPFSTPARLSNPDGVLMSFGPEYEAIGKQAAKMADQILKGVKPAGMPVEIPQF
ncbi:MAG: ABC transporter substrate-binding protein, partial [Anaerolineae bacterium]|nr:ABC transporter substrate-binding protein [Anaerolineae bacterium]